MPNINEQNFEITWERNSNKDWRSRRYFARDFQEAMFLALLNCPDDSRVFNIIRLPVATPAPSGPAQ